MNPFFIIALLLVSFSHGMFLKKDNKQVDFEAHFEKHFLKGIGLTVKRDNSYSSMLSFYNPTHTENSEISNVVVAPQDEIKRQLAKLRKKRIRGADPITDSMNLMKEDEDLKGSISIV